MLDITAVARQFTGMIEVTDPTEDDVWMTVGEVAERHRLEKATLDNLRSRGEGLPFLKLPSGGVRYKLSDVLAAERSGMVGFSWSRLADALALMPGLSAKDREAIVNHLKKAMR